jgi:hypothetical protein
MYKTQKRVALFIVVLLLSVNGHAEYRAFELLIENTEKNTSRTVISNMDQLQYPSYYPLQKNETIQYVDSWMCQGNMSNGSPTCRKPGEAEPKSKSLSGGAP